MANEEGYLYLPFEANRMFATETNTWTTMRDKTEPTGACPNCRKPWDDHQGWEHWPLLICPPKR